MTKLAAGLTNNTDSDNRLVYIVRYKPVCCQNLYLLLNSFDPMLRIVMVSNKPLLSLPADYATSIVRMRNRSDLIRKINLILIKIKTSGYNIRGGKDIIYLGKCVPDRKYPEAMIDFPGAGVGYLNVKGLNSGFNMC